MAYEKTLPDGSPVMTEGQFAVAYIKSLQESGDDVKTENVVASWHTYQRNPAGHFLSKGNQVKASLPAEQGALNVEPISAVLEAISDNDLPGATAILRSILAAPVAATVQGDVPSKLDQALKVFGENVKAIKENADQEKRYQWSYQQGRAAGLEEAAKVAEGCYIKDPFRFELGTFAAAAIRALTNQGG